MIGLIRHLAQEDPVQSTKATFDRKAFRLTGFELR
jgi:hypothetical protein